MNKSVRFLLLITIFGLLVLLTNSTSKKNIEDVAKETVQETKNVAETYSIKAAKIPLNLELVGERVPVERYDIKERMDRELLVNTYWQSNGLLLIKRAHKYFPIIEPMLKKYGLPDDFKYLCVAESGLMNNRSGAGAAGFWQFLKGTARQYGLEVNGNVDERYNLEKATKVAAKYLIKSKNRFGSWTLAAAAYNAGNRRIHQRLQQQKVTNYYDLLLNNETSRYVFRILALKEILSNPKKYGFEYDTDDLYTLPTTYEVKVDTPITNIPNFAIKYGVTYKELKLVNPWLREIKLNNKTKKIYKIKIPEY